MAGLPDVRLGWRRCPCRVGPCGSMQRSEAGAFTPSVLVTVRGRAMARPKRDRLRKDRIRNEAIVDTYGSEEQALGWYYYLEGKLRFPFPAQCIASKVVSPLRKGETVEVRGMAPEDACTSDMLVLVRWQRRNVAVPLS